ncbi:MAG: Omp28-related outer membrane protein [Saprospiraceae bacterium]|nr:Omp28-related outer membrane protein [Saprospiraceae bacterium]
MFKKLLAGFFLVSLASSISAQAVWEETFDGGNTLPAGWTQTTLASDGGWKVGIPSALSSSAFPIPASTGNVLGTNDDGCNCNKSVDQVMTPEIDLTAYPDTALYLMFDIFYLNATYQGATESLSLLASTDGGTTWVTLTALQGAGAWVKPRFFDISSFAGQSVRFGFLYNDGGGWLYGAVIDNIRVVLKDNILKANLSSVGVARFIDAIPASFTYDRFLAGGEMEVTGSVNNPGFVPITSFDVTVTNGLNSITESYTGLNVDLGQSATFSVPVTISEGTNSYDVSISNINGGDDNDLTDNAGTASILGVTPAPGRVVVVEEGTGTWCGWCPRGTVMMDFLAEEHPDHVAAIAVHNGDPMVVSTYDTGLGGVISGYPSGLVDRQSTPFDPTDFEAAMLDRITVESPVAVSQEVEWDEVTRKATVHSKLNFNEAVNGAYRIAVVFTEDGVTGTSAAYGQTNYYSGGGNGPMGGFESLGSTVPASASVYNHVARAIVGGFNGALNSVPTANVAGSEHVYTSEWTVPATMDIEKMHAVTLFIRQSPKVIVNAAQTGVPYTSVAANEPTTESISVRMFPNPVVDEATIKLQLAENSDVQIRVINTMGAVVAERNYANVAGETSLPFRVGTLPTGAYILSVNAGGKTIAKNFVISR